MNTIETIYKHFLKSGKISTDSRMVEDGAVFFALKGDNFDANDFALQVADEGKASLVVCSRHDLPEHDKILKVDDTLTALQQLANHHRKQSKATIIAITGTNGKTTTKELVSAVLERKYNIVNTRGNFNNHIGVPLTLLNIKPETEIAIVEMGANHPGEIDALCHIANPDYGLITNIGMAHLQGFGSFEGIVNTKTELYRYIKEKGKAVFVNRDNDLLWKLSEAQQRLSYGTRPDADTQVIPEDCNPYLNVRWGQHEIATQLIGNYNFENVAAAIAVGQYMQVDENEIVAALESYVPTNNRSQVIESGTNRIVMDAYNANPTSMQAALRNFKRICVEPNLLILGDMRELGDYAEREHRNILSLMEELNFKNAFLVGPNFSAYNTHAGWLNFKNVEELSQYIENHPIKEHQILIKGSRGIRLESILPLL